MRILWLSDFNICAEQGGGGELSDHACYKEGLRRGHELLLGTPEYTKYDAVGESDLLVVSNASRFDRGFLRDATSKVPYVFYAHDYFPLCTWRLHFPGLERCRCCPNLGFARGFVMGSALNIFLSPLHREAWLKAIPELADRPYHLHPSPVDVECFKPLGLPRVPNSVLVINALPFKGSKNVADYAREHPELTFTMIGARDDSIEWPENCYHLGFIPYSRLPEMYSQTEAFLELPNTPQPCVFGSAKVYTAEGWRPIREIKPGELVWTHECRLRKVAKTFRREYRGPTVEIVLRLSNRKHKVFLKFTPEHPVLTRGGWVPASIISAGDEVGTLGGRCKTCGKIIHVNNFFCSHGCIAKFYADSLAPKKLINISSEPLNLDPFELGRLVGMMDGEGTISLKRDRSWAVPLMFITSSNREVLDHIRKITGIGNVRETFDKARAERGGKNVFRWIVEKLGEMYSLLKTITPYLIIKKKQALLLLEYFDLRQKVIKGEIKRAEAISSIDEIGQKISQLNKRTWTNLKILNRYKNPDQPSRSQIEGRKGIEIAFVSVRKVRFLQTERKGPSRYVYNIEVEEDNSYITNLVVHNCQRSAIESKLCGVPKFILNPLVGITSYDWWREDSDKFRERIRKAPAEFWKNVEEVIS